MSPRRSSGPGNVIENTWKMILFTFLRNLVTQYHSFWNWMEYCCFECQTHTILQLPTQTHELETNAENIMMRIWNADENMRHIFTNNNNNIKSRSLFRFYRLKCLNVWRLLSIFVYFFASIRIHWANDSLYCSQSLYLQEYFCYCCNRNNIDLIQFSFRTKTKLILPACLTLFASLPYCHHRTAVFGSHLNPFSNIQYN